MYILFFPSLPLENTHVETNVKSELSCFSSAQRNVMFDHAASLRLYSLILLV